MMSAARLVAQGSEADIIGATTAIAIRTNDWARAFAVLNEAGQPVMLAGRDVRVADADADQVQTILADAGMTADVTGVAATIEERMMVLARARQDP
jgi:ABC-2 type transport system ATP-binding protein